MSRLTEELLRESLAHLELANTYADTKDLDQLVTDAICVKLSAGIEVLARLDPPVRSLTSDHGGRFPPLDYSGNERGGLSLRGFAVPADVHPVG